MPDGRERPSRQRHSAGIVAFPSVLIYTMTVARIFCGEVPEKSNDA